MRQTHNTGSGRVLVSAYEYHPRGVSEAWTAHQLVDSVRALGRRVIVLTRASANKPRWQGVVRVRCVIPKKSLLWMPNYAEFALRSVSIGRRLQRRIRLAHHISPITLRMPSALGMLNVPFIWGPVGGSIPYPPGFESYAAGSWTDNLRRVDAFRLKFDPGLRWTLSAARRVVVTTTMAGELIPGAYREKVLVIPEGVPREFVDPGAGREGDYIFSSGRLIPFKAIDLLVKAFARLPASAPRLVITGDGPMRDSLRALIDQLGIGGRVELKGQVAREENRALMSGALFCVFPSLREAFGHVNLEAMGLAKAVIATDWGGPRDLIEHGVSGLKVLGGDVQAHVEQLAEAMGSLIDNRGLRVRLGAAAAERVDSIYTWSRLGRRYAALYDELGG